MQSQVAIANALQFQSVSEAMMFSATRSAKAEIRFECDNKAHQRKVRFCTMRKPGRRGDRSPDRDFHFFANQHHVGNRAAVANQPASRRAGLRRVERLWRARLSRDGGGFQAFGVNCSGALLMAIRISAGTKFATRESFRSRQVVAATAPQRLLFFVAEETAIANEVGNLRRHRLIPGFVAAGDALQDVS